jgi:hypothetical protein
MNIPKEKSKTDLFAIAFDLVGIILNYFFWIFAFFFPILFTVFLLGFVPLMYYSPVFHLIALSGFGITGLILRWLSKGVLNRNKVRVILIIPILFIFAFLFAFISLLFIAINWDNLQYQIILPVVPLLIYACMSFGLCIILLIGYLKGKAGIEREPHEGLD